MKFFVKWANNNSKWITEQKFKLRLSFPVGKKVALVTRRLTRYRDADYSWGKGERGVEGAL